MTVNNVDPSVEAGPNQTANQGATVSLPPSTFSDPGVNDTHSAVVNWGDGTLKPGAVTEDQGSGTVAGAHIYGAAGLYSTQVCVQDGTGANDNEMACDTFSVMVNGPPNITSTPITNAAENQLYTYDVEATDPENETLTFSLTQTPAGMTINDTTGLIQWTPTSGQVGDHPVTVRVQDTGGLFGTQSFTVSVAKVVNPPSITAIANQLMDEGSILNVAVSATDPDGDPLTLSVSGLHPFGTFADNGNGTGTINFKPGFDDAGSYPMTATASDGNQSTSDDFTLKVSNHSIPFNSIQ